MSEENNMEEMSFLDHLEELRWHVMRSLIAVVAFMVIAFLSKDIIFGVILLAPLKADFWTYKQICKLTQSFLDNGLLCMDEIPLKIQNIGMLGQFSMHLLASFVVGIIVAFPYIFWEIWRFIKPALYGNEKKFARGTVLFVSVLFFTGVLFGYFILTPLSVHFFANYTIDPMVENNIQIKSYISYITTIIIVCGVVFQLPVASFFLARAGFISSHFLVSYKKHAIVVIMLFSAVITPPDPITQIGIAIPIFLIYQLSIIVTRKVEKKREKNSLLEAAKNEEKLLEEITE